MAQSLVSVTLILAVALGLTPMAQGRGLPDLDVASLATGSYSRMYMLLEKTIFSVDVLTVEVRVGEETQRRLEQLARGGRVAEIADAVLAADQVLVSLQFRRAVGFERWLQGVRESLEQARAARLIQEETFRSVSAQLPVWFRPLVERGFVTGDRIVYRGYPDRMRTLVISTDGSVLVDHVDEGAAPRRAMLAGYFAPGTDFREPLVRSLLAP